ncbi:type A chloramphenicol O-acetyltransferase [Enterococcus sp. LJL99]
MDFRLIDKENWKRSEYFNHYLEKIPCSYSFSIKLNITKIIKNKNKLYPTLLYCIIKTVNQYEEFRTSFRLDGNLVIYEEMMPLYTIFDKKEETFSNIWTEYTNVYEKFIEAYKIDLEKYGGVKQLFAKPNIPENVVTISMIPWIEFQSFNLNVNNDSYLLPIFTIGKYYKHENEYVIPMSIQVHHAVCDGFHAGKFVKTLQRELANF